jgi:hypothetical protein
VLASIITNTAKAFIIVILLPERELQIQPREVCAIMSKACGTPVSTKVGS